MLHETPLISTIVVGLVLAFIFGAIANRLRMPPLVGYLVAGVLVGPGTPGFTADPALAAQLAEIGVILLMFGVGLHFSLRDLLSVKALAIPGAVVQIAGATALGLLLALIMGWTWGAGLVFGLALSVASTVVLLKALQDRRLVDSERGRLAVGWLIVEDLAMILALVLIPAFATILGGGGDAAHLPIDPFVSFIERLVGMELGLPGVLAVTLVKIAAFIGFMLVVGRRVIPFLLHATAHTGSRELFRLAVLAIALGVAGGSAYLFGVSLALGAFFAGMILSESELSHRAAQETLPLRDAFAVLFFISVGMLFDPAIFLTNPLPVIATILIIILGKGFLAYWIVKLFRRPVGMALTISASLAQIGEFSFILAALGVSLGILPEEGRDLILAGALVSIVLNPLVFWITERLRPGIEARQRVEPAIEPAVEGAAAEPPAEAAAEDAAGDAATTTLSDHIILIGFGRVGTIIADGLVKEGARFCVIEDAEFRIQAARERDIEVIVGNAASPDVLRRANVEGARSLLIAIANTFEAGQATEQARKLNPGIRIIARAHSTEGEAHLVHLGANTVITGEREIGIGMLDYLDGERTPVETGIEGELAPRLRPTENIVAAAAAAAASATLPVIEAVPVPEPAPEPMPAAEPIIVPPAELVVLDAAEAEPAPVTAPDVPEAAPAAAPAAEAAQEPAPGPVPGDLEAAPAGTIALPQVITPAEDETADADAGAPDEPPPTEAVVIAPAPAETDQETVIILGRPADSAPAPAEAGPAPADTETTPHADAPPPARTDGEEASGPAAADEPWLPAPGAAAPPVKPEPKDS